MIFGKIFLISDEILLQSHQFVFVGGNKLMLFIVERNEFSNFSKLIALLYVIKCIAPF